MNLVAIVGRPNVGKSTLFNRIIGRREAIVEDTPGVTRDRIYGKGEWNGKTFELIDTGGFIPGSEDLMEKAIREQAQMAIEEADSIIFVVDGSTGITKFDEDIAQQLRRSNKQITLVVNKCDNEMLDNNSYEFYKLGLGDPYPISAVNGRSTGDFLDQVVENLSSIEIPEYEGLKIAFVGRPNVGKSSITNALLGYDRMIVSNIPGTTRDSIDSILKYNGQELLLIDTAGLRKRSQVHENIEMWSNVRTGRAIERCDVAVVMIDAERGLEDQDKKIINQVEEARKGIILAINKWDLIEKEVQTADKIRKIIHNDLRTLPYLPIMFVSAETKQRVHKIIDKAIEVDETRKYRIKTSELNEYLMPVFEATPPPSSRGYDMRINYVTQVSTQPPVFALFLNHPQYLKTEYKKFIERKIREFFPFEGTPISLVFRKKN
jgi:GTP-binding protein